MKTKSRSRRLLVLAALLTAGALTMGMLYVRGFWDESTAVHINAGEIETSTLAIGTHLVHLSALTDAIYDIADKSAEESGQSRIYYKSELGEGAWFDITAASSLEDITTGGMPVTDEEIEALFFTHHTKSDKITYDLRTGEAVNIFDIRDPYDLEALEEMQPLKMQYDQIRELQGENEVTERIDQIWETPVTGDEAPPEIGEQEENLAALQAYLNVLHDAEARETEKVGEVMEAVDAARRYMVFTVVKPELEAYLDELGAGGGEDGGEGTEGEEDSVTSQAGAVGTAALESPVYGSDGGEDGDSEEEEEEAGSAPDPELMSAVAETLGNVESALITYGGKMLSEGITVISAAEYDFSVQLINDAKAGNHAACDTDVRNLLHVDNIQNDIISDRPQELALLDSRLLSDATAEYLGSMSRGENAEYRAAEAQNAAQALLNRFIRENEGNVETRRGELEFLILAKTNRVATQEALDFVDGRLELTTNTFASVVPDDAFAETSLMSVEDHIAFLTDLRRQLELALGGNALDQLVAEKADLQTQRMEALDNNDLAAAKELEEQIEAVEEDIRAMEEETAAQISALQEEIDGLEKGSAERAAAEAELAMLESGLSDGTLGATVAQLKNDAISAIQDGDGDVDAAAQAVNAMAALLPTAPKLVLPAMQDVYNELVLNGGDRELIDAIEQAILENPNALREDLSADQIREGVRQWLLEKTEGNENDASPLSGAGGISRRNAYCTALAIVGLQLYYDETGNPNALTVLTALAQEQANLANLLIFNRVDEGVGEYLPLTAIQALTGRRHVWNKNASLGVLAFGADYHGFTVYSDVVRRDRDGVKTEEMLRTAKYRDGVHIPEEYAYDKFGVQAVYLSDTALGCICDDAGMEQARELLARLLAG